MNKLIALAQAFDDGACNQYALARDLGEALEKSGMRGVHTGAYRVILGHLNFLAGEGIGPSSEAMEAFEMEKNQESEIK